MTVTIPPRIAGLSDIAAEHDAILCDIWGVVHNGVALFPGVAEALTKFRQQGKPVVMLTNAPRPSGPIHTQLARLGLPREAYDEVVTSGDCTRDMLAGRPGLRIRHIGPERDLPLFNGLDVRLCGADEAEMIVVTGLYDDTVETPEDYRAELGELLARGLPMVCANPDLVVERGTTMIYCAGAIGALYKEMGGAVTLYGKPFQGVYDLAFARIYTLVGHRLAPSRILAIGDAFATDLRGAQINGISALFVTAGIHAHEMGPTADPDHAKVGAVLAREQLTPVAYLPYLCWA